MAGSLVFYKFDRFRDKDKGALLFLYAAKFGDSCPFPCPQSWETVSKIGLMG